MWNLLLVLGGLNRWGSACCLLTLCPPTTDPELTGARGAIWGEGVTTL